MDKDFDFSQIPHHWALCYVSECPRKQECMRYQACLHAPKGTLRRPCILPTAMQRKHTLYSGCFRWLFLNLSYS